MCTSGMKGETRQTMVGKWVSLLHLESVLQVQIHHASDMTTTASPPHLDTPGLSY